MARKILKIVPVVLLIGTLGLGLANFFLGPQIGEFWKASAVQLLTPLIAVCLTFFATQMKNNQREQTKHVEQIVEKIQAIVSNEQFYKFPNTTDSAVIKETRERIQLTNRKIKNCIDSLTEYSKRLNFEEEANYIKDEFGRYRELIDSSSADFNALSGLYIALKKHAENIDSKCDRISIKLYRS